MRSCRRCRCQRVRLHTARSCCSLIVLHPNTVQVSKHRTVSPSYCQNQAFRWDMVCNRQCLRCCTCQRSMLRTPTSCSCPRLQNPLRTYRTYCRRCRWHSNTVQVHTIDTALPRMRRGLPVRLCRSHTAHSPRRCTGRVSRLHMRSCYSCPCLLAQLDTAGTRHRSKH
jgi:hypothetical protein